MTLAHLAILASEQNQLLATQLNAVRLALLDLLANSCRQSKNELDCAIVLCPFSECR